MVQVPLRRVELALDLPALGLVRVTVSSVPLDSSTLTGVTGETFLASAPGSSTIGMPAGAVSRRRQSPRPGARHFAPPHAAGARGERQTPDAADRPGASLGG